MSAKQPNSHGTSSAAERFFRLYYRHCTAADADTLFNLLNTAHSLNDKLQKEFQENFFANDEFVALKALRNLFHHEGELTNELRVLPVEKLPPISTDLLFLCLVRRTLVERAIAGIEKKRRAVDEPKIRNALKWYGEVVNIYPCIFNFAVHVYEKLSALSIVIATEEYADFHSSYEYEMATGYSHYVSGDLYCHAGDINTVLSLAFADVA